MYQQYISALSLSPLQYSRTVLVNQRLVVRLEFLYVGQIGGLGVQVKFAVKRIKERQLQVTTASGIVCI